MVNMLPRSSRQEEADGDVQKWKCVQKEVNGFRRGKKWIDKGISTAVLSEIRLCPKPASTLLNMKTQEMSACLWWRPVWHQMRLSLPDESRCLVFISCSVPQKRGRSSGLRANDVGHVPLHQAKSEVLSKPMLSASSRPTWMSSAPLWVWSKLGQVRTDIKTELRQRRTLKQRQEGRWRTCWRNYYSHETAVRHQRKSDSEGTIYLVELVRDGDACGEEKNGLKRQRNI